MTAIGAGSTRSVFGERRQLVNDVRRTRIAHDCRQSIAIQRIGHSDGCAERVQLLLLARRTGQRDHLMPCGREGAHEGHTNRSGSTSNKYLHDTVLLSRARLIARPEPSISVSASRTAVVANSGRH